jgi:hypothetical protein
MTPVRADQKLLSLQTPYLQLIARKWRVWSAKSQNIDDAARGPCSHTLIFVGKQIAIGELLGHFAERFLIDFLLVEFAKLLRESL